MTVRAVGRWAILAWVAVGTANCGTFGGSGGQGGSGPTSALSLSGRVRPGGAGGSGQTVPGGEGYMVLAQSARSGEIYQGVSGADGSFSVEIPETESGATFTVAVLRPDGRTAGPVLLGESGGRGLTGLTLDRSASLGTLAVPADAGGGALVAGADGDARALAAADVVARLDEAGRPVGLTTMGKGASAQIGAGQQAASGSAQAALDFDKDGLPDVIDADDDGDGIVDEFDPSHAAGEPPARAGVHLNFFMNLKLGEDRASVYYNGTASQVDAALKTDTVITFEVVSPPDPAAARRPVSARLLAAPAPSYLAGSDKQSSGAGGLTFQRWAATGYAFDSATDRLQAFVIPNGLIDAGDTFTVEVGFSDGTSRTFSRMINYVFKNVPRLRKVGSPAGLSGFSGAQPIHFDAAQDLVVEFNPPKDETGAYLTGMDYHFEMFYEDAGGAQIQGINAAATFASPIPQFNTVGNALFYVVSKDSLILSADNTFTVRLPKGLFVTTVQTASGPRAVAKYKIDIAAQNAGNNAAIMLRFVTP